jgi:hypothetical protein
MAIDIKVELLGDKDIDRMLAGWKPAARRRIVRPGVSKSSRHVSRVARSMAPARSGLLRKSIGAVVRTYPNGTVVGVVGPRHGFKRPVSSSGGKKTIVTKRNVGQFAGSANRIVVQNPVKYAHLVEGGTKPHAIGRGSKIVQRSQTGAQVAVSQSGRKYRKKLYGSQAGEQRGIMHPGSAPKPFLAPAFQRSIPTIKAIMAAEIRKGVVREATRLLRKRGLVA